MKHPPRSLLALYFSIGYALLIVYASLYPMTGWHDSGGNALAFMLAPWPRYTTTFDLVTNVAAYLPLGFFLAAAGRRWFDPVGAISLAVLAGALLSFSTEWIQNYLPSRVASNLDWAGNVFGTVVGALPGALLGPRLIDGLRHTHWPGQGGRTDAGLLLLGLWLLTQFDPTTLLFGTGDLRWLLAPPAAEAFNAEAFSTLEKLIAAAATLAILLAAGLLAPSRQRRLFPLGLLCLGLAARTLAFTLMMAPQSALAWATPGSLRGLAAGSALWLLASFLSPAVQRALAALALTAATVLVNLAPPNPYLENTLQIWNPGQFLNFHGATHLAALLWPWIALPWLVLHPRNPYSP
jgi:VanZ family protein